MCYRKLSNFQVLLAMPANLDLQVLQAFVCFLDLDRKDPRVLTGHPENLVTTVNQVAWDTLDLLGLEAPLDVKVHLERKDHPERYDIFTYIYDN